MGGDKLISSVAAPTLGSPTSPDRKLLRHPILASQYKELVTEELERRSHSSFFGPHPTPVQDSSFQTRVHCNRQIPVLAW